MKNAVFIGQWQYLLLSDEKQTDGRTVLIRESCFGPLEVYEWGIDRDGKPYESYEWIENDLYKHENYQRNITEEQLKDKIRYFAEFFEKNGHPEWAYSCKNMLRRLQEK